MDNPTENIMAFDFSQRNVTFDQCSCKIIILRDVSEFLKVEYAQTIEKVADSMIASTSHDMRTPLNAITNMIELV